MIIDPIPGFLKIYMMVTDEACLAENSQSSSQNFDASYFVCPLFWKMISFRKYLL